MPTLQELQNSFNTRLNDSFTSLEKRQLAKLFLGHYLQLSSSDFILRKNEVIKPEIAAQILQDIEAIEKGRPAQYVLGKVEFYGLEIKTDERALIPRPETEELVDWMLKEVNEKEIRLLDVGTGSGCIALAYKSERPKSKVVGVDIQQEALDLALENAQRLQLEVEFKKANGLQLDKTLPQSWNVIVSNPPYVLEKDKLEMQKHVLEYEPHSALFVPDDDPLLFYREIAKYAIEHLVEDGHLFFEIHEDFAEQTKELLSFIGFQQLTIRKDLQGKNRMIHARKKS